MAVCVAWLRSLAAYRAGIQSSLAFYRHPWHLVLLNQISGLTRAVAYKKRVELQNKTDLEAGASDVKTMLWNAMAKERPDLYKQVSGYLDRKVQEGKP